MLQVQLILCPEAPSLWKRPRPERDLASDRKSEKPMNGPRSDVWQGIRFGRQDSSQVPGRIPVQIPETGTVFLDASLPECLVCIVSYSSITGAKINEADPKES